MVSKYQMHLRRRSNLPNTINEIRDEQNVVGSEWDGWTLKVVNEQGVELLSLDLTANCDLLWTKNPSSNPVLKLHS